MKFKKTIRLSQTDKLNLISNLGTMISAGIPILSAVSALSEEARGNVKLILDGLYTDMLQGKHVYESLAKYPDVFDMVFINMIKAAEEAGNLDVILQDLKEQIKKDIAFTRKIKSAMVYPILVLIVFIAMLLLILIVVMPKIATVFSQLKVNMPLPTKGLIFASNILLHQTVYVILGISLITGLTVFLYTKKRKKFIAFLYRLPYVSRLIKEIDLLKFSRSLHLLLTSGITINTALELTEKVVVNAEIAKTITQAKNNVTAGKPLSYTFKQNRKIFPGTMIELTISGEKTGSLDKSMQQISEYFDYRVTDTLAFLTTLLEPIMLVLVAILVGSMMVSIIGPIYNLIGQVSPT